MNEPFFESHVLRFDREADCVTMVFQHDLDMETMMTVKLEIERYLPSVDRPMIVDLTRVEFLDSAAVGVLAMVFRHTNRHDLPLVIGGAQPQPEAVLGMVGLSDHVKLFPTCEEAKRAVISA